MDLTGIAQLALFDEGYRTIGGGIVTGIAQDDGVADMQRHDAVYHPEGYKDGDTCKYRERLAKGDLADASIDPENVEGEEKPKGKSAGGGEKKSDAERMKEIFREYRHNVKRSDKWLVKNLGITDSGARSKAMTTLAAFGMGQVKKDKALDRLMSLSSGLPSDAWKPGKKSGSKGKDVSQPMLPMFIGGGQSAGGDQSRFYHAQGSKQYSQEKHDATGLYKTLRPFGKSLAREEDVPGLTPFHKRRPFFNETATVPSRLSDEELSHFRWTANGSTYPTVGNVNGRNYIVKHGLLKGGIRRNADLTDHLRHEVAADKFIRNAGLRAPVCTTFERQSKIKGKDGNPKTDLVKVAEYVDGGVGLAHAWFQATDAERAKMRQQVIDAYPVMSFLENVDAFKNDNILVDRDWNLWFVDNGACFDYRAQGGRKLLDDDNRMATSKNKDAKPWYYEREDPTDFVTGYLGLAYAPDQRLLAEILKDTTDGELVEAAKKYDFTELVKSLPAYIQKPGLVRYAGILDAAVRNPPSGWIDGQ